MNRRLTIGPNPEPNPLAMYRIPIPAATSPKPASLPIRIRRNTCAPPPEAHMAFAKTTLLIEGFDRIYFHPERISSSIALGLLDKLPDFSGPPCGRVMIRVIATRKVTESIQSAVSIPYCEMVRPPIPAPIPMAADHPPEDRAFAESNSSFVQILGT